MKLSFRLHITERARLSILGPPCTRRSNWNHSTRFHSPSYMLAVLLINHTLPLPSLLLLKVILIQHSVLDRCCCCSHLYRNIPWRTPPALLHLWQALLLPLLTMLTHLRLRLPSLRCFCRHSTPFYNQFLSLSQQKHYMMLTGLQNGQGLCLEQFCSLTGTTGERGGWGGGYIALLY